MLSLNDAHLIEMIETVFQHVDDEKKTIEAFLFRIAKSDENSF